MNNRASILVFIGPPGSGKGTLAQQCVKDLGWVQVSAGNLCRKAIAENSPLGQQIATVINSGGLVSDTIMGSMVEEWLLHQLGNNNTVILDGYPRTSAQAYLLNNFLQNNVEHSRFKVVHFIAPDEVIERRLGSRLVCSNVACQMVYSLNRESSRIPTKNSVCDVCGYSLVKRGDDDITTIKERLAMYYKHERELLDFYRSNNKDIIELTAGGTPAFVFERFCAQVGGTSA